MTSMAVHSISRRSAAAVLLALGGLVGGMAQASGLQVSPVLVLFGPEQRAQALSVSNTGDKPLQAQVRVMRWSQENGEERLTPADDIALSPAIVTVPAGKKQTVRLVRKSPVAPASELSNRVMVDELPDKRDAAPATGLKVLLRYSIPLFVAPKTAAVPAQPGKPAANQPAPTDVSQLRATLVEGKGGKAVLQVQNQGTRHVRISALSAEGANGQTTPLGSGLIGYVLPGQQMRWPVNLSYPVPTGITLKAQFNDDRQAQTMPMEGASR